MWKSREYVMRRANGEATPEGALPRADRMRKAEPVRAVEDAFMDRAIDLAGIAAGRTGSNPMVGAVVVKDGNIVGEGYHERFGFDHAEVVALDQAGGRAEGATLYVSLEPCVHYGKTPPCVERVISSGVRRVVVATLDPDARVDGRGVHALRRRGIDVEVGRRAARALVVNIGYFKRQLGLAGAATLKMAVTLDGRIASAVGRRDDITGDWARLFVHRLRSVHDAVLVGSTTLLVDRPRLDCRDIEGVEDPIPVVLDTRLRFPEVHPWLERKRKFIVCCGVDGDEAKARRIEAGGGTVVRCPAEGGRLDLTAVLAALRDRGIGSVLVEGGGSVFTSFVSNGLWDALHLFVSPRLFGPEAPGLSERRVDAGIIGAAAVHAAVLSGDTMTSYLNGKILETLLERLVPREEP